MGPPSTPAVFLSYASQDAEAAKKICVALRAAGIEVWFDQNELRGGDAWDQKIKRQIKECALFMPVISANTNARAEGYFRLEWKLAVDRSHLMADDAPFLFPVVIDDLADAAARVPDRFREVQWTRLGAKDAPETLAARVVKLLAGEMEPGRLRPGERAEGAASSASATRESPARQRSRWIGYLAAVGGILIGVVYALRPHEWGRRPEKTVPPAASTSATAPATPPVPAVSESRQLVAKARALYEAWDFASREDFLLAEQLLKRAADLDPADGEVCAAQVVLSCGFVVFNYDTSPARSEFIRNQSERAMRLAPDSPSTRFARAFALRFQPGTSDEALRLLREEAARQPDNRFVVRTLGASLRAAGKYEEALTYLDRVAALPGGDAIAQYNRSMALAQMGRPADAEAAADQALALRPNYGQAMTRKILLLLREHGDVAQARKVAEKMPADFLLDDRGAAPVSEVWLLAHEPDRCIASLRPASDYMQTNFFTGPKAYRTGLAHRMAGRPDAAAADWRAALQVVEQRLRAQPNSPVELGWKALLLALLGENAEAERVLRMAEQFNRAPSAQTNFDIWKIYVALGRHDVVVQGIADVLKNSRVARSLAVEVRYSPEIDQLRNHPRFPELLKMLPPEPKP